MGKSIKQFLLCFLILLSLFVIALPTNVHAEGDGTGDSGWTTGGTQILVEGASPAKTGWLISLAKEDGTPIKAVFVTTVSNPVLSTTGVAVDRSGLVGRWGATYSNVFAGAEWHFGPWSGANGRGNGRALKQWLLSEYKDGLNCPYLSNQKIWCGFNDLASYPEYEYLIKQWHPTKNGNLKPCDVMPGSNLKVWWIFPYDDISTGKHYDFEWESYIFSRTLKGSGCPYLTHNPLVYSGFNDLKTKYPKIVKDWDYEKNGNLKPDMVTYASHKKVYWKCEKGHSWCIEVKKRTLENHNCPICSNQKVLEGYNDLASHPKYGYLAKEWHPTKNGDLKPTMIMPFSNKKVYWLCPNGHTYQASLCNRTRLGQGCRECAGSAIEKLAYSILRKYNIEFDREYSFKNNIEIGKYRYDIYMKKFKMIVELDGEQHFKSAKSSFFNEELPFEERVHRDNLKNKFALENKIPILRIPYIYLPGRDKEKIEKFINTFLFTKQVPKEIIDFYGTFEFSNYKEVATKLNKIYNSKV